MDMSSMSSMASMATMTMSMASSTAAAAASTSSAMAMDSMDMGGGCKINVGRHGLGGRSKQILTNSTDAVELVHHRRLFVPPAPRYSGSPTDAATGFLAESWHVRSAGAFAASCIGVALLAFSIEFFRRVGKEYDSAILRKFQSSVNARSADLKTSNGSESSLPEPQYLIFRATPLQQFIRSVIHAITFGVAYIVMLLGKSKLEFSDEDTNKVRASAMYYNGYIIFSIFIGAGLGKFVCDWMVQKVPIGGMLANSTSQTVDETTVCCG